MTYSNGVLFIVSKIPWAAIMFAHVVVALLLIVLVRRTSRPKADIERSDELYKLRMALLRVRLLSLTLSVRLAVRRLKMLFVRDNRNGTFKD